MGEFAAGAFGRSLAALESSSGAEGSASLDLAERSRQVREAVGNFQEASAAKESADTALKEARDRETKKQAALDAAKNEQEANRAKVKEAETRDPPAPQAEKDSLAQDLRQSDSDVARLNSDLERIRGEIARLEAEQSGTNRRFREAEHQRDLKLAAQSDAKARASAEAAGSITPGKQKPEIAKVIHEIQRKYVENINSDATEIACLSAMERNPGSDLARFCQGTLLVELAKGKNLLHQRLLERATFDRDYAKKRRDIIDIMIDLENLLGARDKLNDPAQPINLIAKE